MPRIHVVKSNFMGLNILMAGNTLQLCNMSHGDSEWCARKKIKHGICREVDVLDRKLKYLIRDKEYEEMRALVTTV